MGIAKLSFFFASFATWREMIFSEIFLSKLKLSDSKLINIIIHQKRQEPAALQFLLCELSVILGDAERGSELQTLEMTVITS